MNREAAILAAPGDDCPRLLLADWWDENGQPERAEFVRVQVALASFVMAPCKNWCGLRRDGHCEATTECQFHALRRRERELWELTGMGGDGWRISAVLPDAFANCIPQNDLASSESVSMLVWRRGFPELCQATAAAWLAHADALTAAAPIRQVRLTTYPDWMHDGPDIVLHSGERGSVVGRVFRRCKKPYGAPEIGALGPLLTDILRDEWDGKIDFEFPYDSALAPTSFTRT